MSDHDENIIEYKRQWVVGSHLAGVTQTARFDEVDDAFDRIRFLLSAANERGLAAMQDEDGALNGHITWHVDEEVPATYLDELLGEYGTEIHGPEMNRLADMGIDRDDRYLLVEENCRGGYWLYTGDDAEHMVRGHLNQEYAEDWSLVGVFDLQEGREVEVRITQDVKINVEA